MLVLWVIRFFVFTLHESPKYLMGRGRLDEAVAVVHAIAKYNGRQTDLTVDQLHDAGLPREEIDRPKRDDDRDMLHPPDMDTSAFAAFRRGLKAYDGSLIRSLFATPKLAISTSLIISLWGMGRLKFFLLALALIDFPFSDNWPCRTSLQRVYTLLPFYQRSGVWRRLGLHHIPKQCYSWLGCTSSWAFWGLGGGASTCWKKRDTLCVYL